MGKESITEEMKVHEEWYKETDDINTLADLTGFIGKLITQYNHDYGTICHAVTAAAVAAAKVVDRSPTGGISGFQAGCIMWEFMMRFNRIEPPARLIQFKDMLYPQHESKFQKTICSGTWKFLQDDAKKKNGTDAHPDVKAHWQSIRDGVVPFGYTVVDE